MKRGSWCFRALVEVQFWAFMLMPSLVSGWVIRRLDRTWVVYGNRRVRRFQSWVKRMKKAGSNTAEKE